MGVVQRMKKAKLINGLSVMLNPASTEEMWRKFAEDRRQSLVGEHSQWRCEQCWLCQRRAITWVREIVFDNGTGDDPDPKTKLEVNSDTYQGPVPGFCHFHLGGGPRQLAEVVYNDSLIVAWGYRPSRWFVFFTDGTRVQGAAVEIDPNPERAPITQDEHLQGAQT